MISIYDYDVETKQLSINEDGAELVRYIFNRYISGAGGTMIARELNEQGYLTIRGNPWSCSSVIGIITNEKYIGDVLQGKTYTVDPISKRRVNNYGQEDRFYIKNHHEPIISKEVYDKAQEIRLRRNQGRKGFETGKREKYSRKYAFSSLVQCEFCGGFLSRRSWHSGTKHQKTIWQCNVAIKKGKQFCPNSKGIAEKIIEDAFVEAYQLMASENRDMLDEFIARVERTLSGNSAREMISQLTKRLYSLQDKRQRLLDNFLNGVVVKEVYLDKDKKFEKDISVLKKQIKEYEILNKNEAAINKRMIELRKALSTNIVLDKFDREVFESIIAKVIVGGYNKDNTINPYKITFIFKTGLQSEINGKN